MHTSAYLIVRWHGSSNLIFLFFFWGHTMHLLFSTQSTPLYISLAWFIFSLILPPWFHCIFFNTFKDHSIIIPLILPTKHAINYVSIFLSISSPVHEKFKLNKLDKRRNFWSFLAYFHKHTLSSFWGQTDFSAPWDLGMEVHENSLPVKGWLTLGVAVMKMRVVQEGTGPHRKTIVLGLLLT